MFNEMRTAGFGDVLRDVRYSVRALAASPRFTVVALLTVALMVGGISTIFTLVQAVLLRPLPYPASDRLVVVESIQPKAFSPAVTIADVTIFQERGRSFDLWGVYRPGYVDTVLDTNGEPISVQDMRVTSDVFPMFGIGMTMGRPLLPADSGASAADVAIISHDLWQTLFAGTADVVGKTISLRKIPYTIVGVTAPGADVPRNWLTYPIVWRPIREGTEPELRFTPVARLREGISIERARTELKVLAERLAVEYPSTHSDRTATVTLLLDKIVGDFKRVLWMFFGAMSCVLLIGLGNLTSLQLARNGTREREISVRTALGASRWRVVRQLTIETVVMCGVGAVIGLAIAWMAVQSITPSLPARFPRADQIGLDFGVALFACGVSLVLAVIVGVLPALQASRVDLARRLNEGGRAATLSAARSRTQRTLIAFQTAVALVLLIGAGLLGNSFYRLIGRDAGMQEDGLWTVNAGLPSRYRDEAVQAEFWTSALEQIRGVRGVESAALAVNATGPLSGGDISEGGVVPEGVSIASPRDGLSVSTRRVSEGYFHTLGMPLVKGRPILASDTAGTEPVVVVNELAATALWPGQDPIGKRLQSRRELRTVVGVIPTFRHSRLHGELSPQMFTPYLQQRGIASSAVIMLRADPEYGDVATAVRSVLSGLEKDMRVTTSTMADVRWRLLSTERFRAAVLLAFAVVAVFLALVGIFGLVAYTVGQRKREIAVRVALGAVRRDVLRVASRQAIAPAFVGLLLGVIGASLATRLLSAFLVDIQPIDVPTFVGALGALALASVVAGVMPARQALAIDPVETLRAE